MQNSKAVTSLNKVWGAIFAVAMNQTFCVYAMHNRTAKKAVGAKTKEEAVEMMRAKYPILANATEDECDAVLMVDAYINLYVSELMEGVNFGYAELEYGVPRQEE